MLRKLITYFIDRFNLFQKKPNPNSELLAEVLAECRRDVCMLYYYPSEDGKHFFDRGTLVPVIAATRDVIQAGDTDYKKAIWYIRVGQYWHRVDNQSGDCLFALRDKAVYQIHERKGFAIRWYGTEWDTNCLVDRPELNFTAGNATAVSGNVLKVGSQLYVILARNEYSIKAKPISGDMNEYWFVHMGDIWYGIQDPMYNLFYASAGFTVQTLDPAVTLMLTEHGWRLYQKPPKCHHYCFYGS